MRNLTRGAAGQMRAGPLPCYRQKKLAARVERKPDLGIVSPIHRGATHDAAAR